MKAMRLGRPAGLEALTLVEADTPPPGRGEITVLQRPVDPVEGRRPGARRDGARRVGDQHLDGDQGQDEQPQERRAGHQNRRVPGLHHGRQ